MRPNGEGGEVGVDGDSEDDVGERAGGLGGDGVGVGLELTNEEEGDCGDECIAGGS